MAKPKLYTPKEIRRLADDADVSPPTAKKFLDGGKVQPSLRARLVAAMAASEPKGK